jgi:REP element-mobilizing transposase RayT
MPRPIEFSENCVYHIYNRGAAKLPIFRSPDDYLDFQDILRYLLVGFPNCEVYETSQSLHYSRPIVEKLHLPISYKADPQSNGLFKPYLQLLAHCLMPNHFHLLIRLMNPDGQLKRLTGSLRNFSPVSEFIKRLLITYAHKFNYRNNHQGTLLQGRTKIKQVDTDEYVVQVARYIHLNPVSAGLVKNPELWPYSDYQLYFTPESLRSLRNFSFTKPEFILGYFGNRSEEYVKFVEAGIAPDEAIRIFPFTIDHNQED